MISPSLEPVSQPNTIAFDAPPPAATMQALQAAAAGRRRAETALLASISTAETPLVDLNPAAISAIVQALHQVGEGYAGRLFAVETAIAHGL